jgi:hypothetical protein
MAAKVKPSTPARETPERANPGKYDRAGGTYVYDKALGEVVKISGDIPKVASKSSGKSFGPGPAAGPCGRTECGGGRCANS